MASAFTGPFDPSSATFPYLVGPPSTDPIATILNVATGGINLVPAVFPNRAFFAKLLGSQTVGQFFKSQDTVCTVDKNNTSPWRLVNAAGEEAAFPVTIKQSPPQCTYEGAKAIADTIEATTEFANTMTSANQVRQLSGAFDVLKAMEGMAGCSKYVEQFLTFSNATVTLENSRECPYRHEDPLWESSPCCNRAIIDQCCAPGTRYLKVDVISSVDNDLISNSCNNPGQIQALLNLAATASTNTALKAPYDPQTAFESYTSFINSCQSTIFQKSCTTDSDCIYSKKCGNDLKCSVDYNNPAPLLFQCYVSTMKSELLIEVENALGISSSYSSLEEEALAVASVLLPQVSLPSCNGPTGRAYSGSFTETKGSDGNIETVYTPGNQTLCLHDKQCNYEPWSRNDQTSCLADNAPGYCAVCDGYWCDPISRVRQCTLELPQDLAESAKSEVCAANNGRFASRFGQTSCFLDSRNGNQSSCFAFNNGSSCASNSTSPNRCSEGFCKSNETQTECVNNHSGNQQVQWQNYTGGDACVYRVLNYNSCKASNKTWVVGVSYDDGSLNTPESCPSKACADNFSGDRSNKVRFHSSFYF